MELETRVAIIEVRMDTAEGTGQKLIEEVARLDRKIGDLALRMDTRFDQMDTRFERMEARFVLVDTRFGTMEERFTGIHQEFTSLHKEISNQSKFLLALAIGSATIVSVLHPVMLKLLGQ